MLFRRTALSLLVAAVCLAPGVAQAQEDRTASAVGFGGASLNTFSNAASRIDFGATVGKELTPNIHVIGEFGRVGDMTPSLTAGLASLSPYDFGVSALYGEGGVRLVGAPNSGISPYGEATFGIARLTPHISGFGSGIDAIAAAAFHLFPSTDPILGVGGGFLLRGGPVVADLGYRYKQVAGGDSFASLLAAGGTLRAHQVRFGIGVRF